MLPFSGERPAGAAPPGLTQTTRGYVAALDMDGALVAYDVEGALQGPPCNRLFAWNVKSGRQVVVSGKRTCSADDTSTGGGVTEIAVAGSRVAWLVNQGGNTESNDYLYTSSLLSPKERLIATAARTGDVDCVLEGRAIGGLVGDADLLAVNRWTSVAGDRNSCETGVSAATLRRIRTSGTTPIAAGSDAWLAQSADLGRIAVERADGTVGLYSRTGRLLREVTPSSVREVALQGNQLVVLREANTLQIFNATTGAAQFARNAVAGAAQLAVHSGVAVYSVGRRVYAIELATGRSAVVATAPRPVVGLALEGPGAVYAYNSLYTTAKGEVGNVVFLPFDRLHRRLGG
jgi:hypothetical protein